MVETNSKVAFLFFVDAVNNHNKFYRMIDNGDDTFTAEYGRVGAHGQLKQYPMSRWDTVTRSKLLQMVGTNQLRMRWFAGLLMSCRDMQTR